MAHPKNELIDRVKKQGQKGPEFETEKTGPEHEPRFQSLVRVDGAVLGRGDGSSKRVAEAAAAEAALAALNSRAASGAAEVEEPTKKPAKKPSSAKKSSGGKKAKSPDTAPTPSGNGADKAEPSQATPTQTKPKQAQAAQAQAAQTKPAQSKPENEAPANTGKNAASSAPKKQPDTKKKRQSKKQSAPAQQRAAQPSATAAPRQPQAAAAETDATDEPFDGPWPMFDDLLAAALQIADRRVPADLKGDAALAAVRDFSLKLYKDLLSDLGELQDVDED